LAPVGKKTRRELEQGSCRKERWLWRRWEAASFWRGPRREATEEEVEWVREEEVRRNLGRERWGGGGRERGKREGEENMTVSVRGIGLKRRGPRMGLAEGPERRSGGAKTVEIGKRDFHSDDKFIVGEEEEEEEDSSVDNAEQQGWEKGASGVEIQTLC
jgi:hypothetical protein